MKYLILNILCLVFIVSCTNWDSKIHLELKNQTLLEEDENTTIRKLPRYPVLINSETFAFNNNEELISFYNLKTGKLIENIMPNFNVDSLLIELNKANDTAQIYDVSTSTNPLLRNMQKYRILEIVLIEDSFFVFYRVMNSLIYKKGNIRLQYFNYITKTDLKGRSGRIYHIVYDYKKFLNTYTQGIYYDLVNNCIYTKASYNSDNKKYDSIPVNIFSLSYSQLTLTDVYHFPFPEKIWFKDSLSKNIPKYKNANVAVFCQFFNFKDQILFLNGLSVFNLNTQKEIYKIKNYNDSIHRMKSFAMFHNKKNKTDYLVYIDDVYKRPGDMESGSQYLVLEDLKNNCIDRIYLGKKTSGLMVHENDIYIMKEETERIKLLHFKFVN